jgi:hypothetical protein
MFPRFIVFKIILRIKNKEGFCDQIDTILENINFIEIITKTIHIILKIIEKNFDDFQFLKL